VNDTNSWIDVFGLECKIKMQPYRFDDVRVKGPHADVKVNGKKVIEAKLGLNGDKLEWTPFGRMKNASDKAIAEANMNIDNLLNDTAIMNQARGQVQNAIKDFESILKDPKSSSQLRDLASRGLEKFTKMDKLF
jgi:hypothetical protein